MAGTRHPGPDTGDEAEQGGILQGCGAGRAFALALPSLLKTTINLVVIPTPPTHYGPTASTSP